MLSTGLDVTLLLREYKPQAASTVPVQSTLPSRRLGWGQEGPGSLLGLLPFISRESGCPDRGLRTVLSGELGTATPVSAAARQPGFNSQPPTAAAP